MKEKERRRMRRNESANGKWVGSIGRCSDEEKYANVWSSIERRDTGRQRGRKRTRTTRQVSCSPRMKLEKEE